MRRALLTPDLAACFAGIALGHVTREYPNKLDHVLAGPGDVKGPRALHPVFYGSFDWHSCVHGYWTLARLYRAEPTLPERAAVRALFDEHLVAEKVAAEVAYLARPASRGFERPYGWAWLLMLGAELSRHESAEGRAWAGALRPLCAAVAGRFRQHLPLATYPVRAGTHANSAFALALGAVYAAACGDAALGALLGETARRWYGEDRDCQAWEPSGEDFLSPALIEAEAMRRLLPAEEHRRWLAAFLPRLGRGEPAALFTPAVVSDRTDGRIAHLDGLNLSRAWCWQGIAEALPEGDPARARAGTMAGEHLAAGLPHVAGDYMGEHWLASFALLALTE
jgi:Protein of unknown function (DUF2891)